MKKILLALPTKENIETDTFKSIYNLYIPEGYGVHFETFYGYRVDQVRNLIATFAIENEFDYVLFVDSDITFEKDSLLKLLNVESDIVSGVYRQRKISEVIPEIYMTKEGGGTENISIDILNQIDTPFMIAGCGFGFVLVKTEVLKTVGYPQFEYRVAKTFEKTVSEDTDFCLKAIAKGFKIACNPEVLCGHIMKIDIRTK